MQGKPLYDFSLASTGGMTFQRSALRGAKVVVLYFYPNDSHARSRRAGTRLFKQKIRFPFRGHAQEVLNFVKAL
jgi:peroxiredoxin